MPTADEQIQLLQTQQQMTVRALKAFLEGNLDGPGSATWLLAAISPDEAAPVPAPFGFDR